MLLIKINFFVIFVILLFLLKNIFFFEEAKMRYINKSFVPLAQEVPKKTKQS